MATKFLSTLSGTAFGAAGDEAVSVRVSGDSVPRVRIDAGGKITWGSGSATGDVTLYRSAANALKTDDTLQAVAGVITATTDGAPSAALADGAIAIDTTNDAFYFRSSSTWSQVSGGGGASLSVSDGPPDSPSAGDLWFESDTGRTLVYYADGSSNQWVEIGLASASGASGADGKIQFSESDSLTSDTLLHWDNSNNRLGVGTSSPDQALTVAGDFQGYGIHIDSSSGSGIEIDRGASSNSHGILFQTAGVNDWYIGNHNDGDALVIKDGSWTGTEIARFTPTGLGVGVTAPGQPLVVRPQTNDAVAINAIAKTDGSDVGAVQIGISPYNSTSDTYVGTAIGAIEYDASDRRAHMAFFTRGSNSDAAPTERMRITSAGEVAIGAATPNAPLSIKVAASDNQKVWEIQENAGDSHFFLTSDAAGSGSTGNSVSFESYWTGDILCLRGDGNVGIGTTSPTSTFTVAGNIRTSGALIVEGTNATAIRMTQTDTDGAYISITETDGSTRMGYMGFPSNDDLHLKNETAGGHVYLSTNNTTRLTVTNAGNVGIGDATPAQKLVVAGSAAFTDSIQTGQEAFTIEPWAGATIALGSYGSVGTEGSYRLGLHWNYARGNDNSWHALGINSYTSAGSVQIGNEGIIFRTDASYGASGEATERLRINTAGKVKIGTDNTSVSASLHVNSGTVNHGMLQESTDGESAIAFKDNASTGNWFDNSVGVDGNTLFLKSSGSKRLKVASNLVTVVGALTKGSGTFDIPHPVKGGDWRLRHSFIEGPKADLIYRGTVTLSGGTAAIDLDTESDMTDGTWEALCANPWAMVASSGNAVEWSLSGKTLTITSDTADAVCSWMVIGERQDDHMKSSEGVLADDDGHLIVEYEKEPDPPDSEGSSE